MPYNSACFGFRKCGICDSCPRSHGDGDLGPESESLRDALIDSIHIEKVDDLDQLKMSIRAGGHTISIIAYSTAQLYAHFTPLTT
jgi:hypothetical protein